MSDYLSVGDEDGELPRRVSVAEASGVVAAWRRAVRAADVLAMCCLIAGLDQRDVPVIDPGLTSHDVPMVRVLLVGSRRRFARVVGRALRSRLWPPDALCHIELANDTTRRATAA